MNKPYKQHLRYEYNKYKEAEIMKLRSSGVTGKVKVQTSRDHLIIWSELFMTKFNAREEQVPMLPSAFAKTGVNVFDRNTHASLQSWLNSLEDNAIYKSMIECAGSENLDD